MSVISRMLRDLEARKAQPGAGDDARTLKPESARPRARPRRRGAGQRRIAILLAVVLSAVAAALWWQRAPELRAGLVQALDRVGVPWEESRADPANSANDTAADAQANAAAESRPERPPARLAAARFTGAGDEAALELRLEGEPPADPAYSREGAAVSLRVPADAAQLEMPAPPVDQRVFKSVTLQADAERGATLRLRVAEGARFDLMRSPGGVTLSGRLTAAPASASAEPGDVPTSRQTATAQQPEVAAEDEAADPAEQAAAATAASEPAPAEPASATADRKAAAEEPSPQVATAAKGTSDSGADQHTTSGVSAMQSPAEGGAMQKEDRSSPAMRAERRYREARNAISDGDIGRARELLRAALELDPGLHRARDLLVALHRRAGQADAARDVLAEGVEQAPARVAYAKPYARLLVDAGELDRAARVLADAAGGAGSDAEFHALTAAVAQRRGRHEAAAGAYTRALELEADQGRWWFGLGVSLAAAGHPGEASAAFREARRTGSLAPRLDAWARGRIQALEGSGG